MWLASRVGIEFRKLFRALSIQRLQMVSPFAVVRGESVPVSGFGGGRKEPSKADLLLGPMAMVMGPLCIWALDLQPENWGAREAVTACQDLGRGPFGCWTWNHRQLPAGLVQTRRNNSGSKELSVRVSYQFPQREGR